MRKRMRARDGGGAVPGGGAGACVDPGGGTGAWVGPGVGGGAGEPAVGPCVTGSEAFAVPCAGAPGTAPAGSMPAAIVSAPSTAPLRA